MSLYSPHQELLNFYFPLHPIHCYKHVFKSVYNSNKFIALSVLLLRYEASLECQPSPFHASVHKFRGHYVPSSASFPNHLLFGKSGHKSNSQRISFSLIPFFFFLPRPTIFFSQTAMWKINELGVSSLLNFLVFFCLT